jgi:hypothetical protein
MAAPWYNDSAIFGNIKAPRTPNWNQSCPDHHWLVRSQPPMTAEQESRSDELFRARWRALLSVDDLVDALVATLEKGGTLATTYIIFTSGSTILYYTILYYTARYTPYRPIIQRITPTATHTHHTHSHAPRLTRTTLTHTHRDSHAPPHPPVRPWFPPRPVPYAGREVERL